MWLVVSWSLFPDPMVLCPAEIVVFVVLDCRFVKTQKCAFYSPSPRFFAFLHSSCMPPHLPYFCSHPMDPVYRFSDMLCDPPLACSFCRSLARHTRVSCAPPSISIELPIICLCLVCYQPMSYPHECTFPSPKHPSVRHHKYAPDAKMHLCTSPLTS